MVRRVASSLLGMPVRRQFAVMLTPWAVAAALGAPLTWLLGAASAAPLAVAFVLLLVAYTLVMALAPTVVRVGREGVELSWLMKRRFIAFSRITEAEAYLDVGYGKESHGVQLALHDGATVRIPTGAEESSRALAAALMEDIGGGRARVDVEPPPLPEALMRHGDSPAKRALALRRLTHADDLRTNAVPLERLLRIVESDGASTSDRASAAVAAAASGDPSARERIRVVSESTSFPELHAFLAQVVDPRDALADDEALAVELEAVDRRARERAK